MKTAISIPDELFEGAERLARRTRRSRSRLFADALPEYLARHAPDKITESMDRALAKIGDGKDPFASSVARRVLGRTECCRRGKNPAYFVHGRNHVALPVFNPLLNQIS
jgi:predicted transcriptional regulator